MSESKKTAGRATRPLHNKEPIDALCFEPTELVFTDAVVGQSYEMELNIRNQTTNRHPLKIYGPKYKEFEIDYER